MLRKAHLFFILLSGAALLTAAPPSRITRAVDASRTVAAPGRVHHLAQAQYDLGAVDPKKQLNYMVMLMKPSRAQQADLDALLVDQQNPSSKNFRQWLTPEQFGGRFGLNSSDQSKVVAWLTAQGFSVDHVARSNNWVAFSGSAAQVSSALHTPIHQFQVYGKTHFANTQVPSIPEALSDVAGGFLGLNDFPAHSNAKVVTPDYTTGNTHYLAPADFATIYDVAPLYAAGIDGTGQSIAIVGESDVLLSDIAAFRSRYGLPVNAPKLFLYGTDPGYNGAQVEGNLDLEWAGAIAPKATIYYVYGTSAFIAMEVAVESNQAQVISVSYGSCEIDTAYPGWSSIAQQGNAQGITLLAASGDAGAAGCDSQSAEPFATRGLSVIFPAVLPEVTGVGGTIFVEGTGSYWGATNSGTFGSALSYIPEAAWNESATSGLGSTGGGVSRLYPQPAWQNGAGVPSDNFRHVPDVSFTSAGHDAYFITYLNSNYVSVSGTSCGTPAMAAVVALLNHYQVTNKFQKTPGLGNINPQLYRMAQAAPTAFHDVTTGNNQVQCAQGSPDCLTGSLGYTAGAAYDMATGLGSIDTNVLVTQWNKSVNGVVVTLSTSVAKGTLNDTVQLTAMVTAATGSGTPTGTVNFTWDITPLGSAPLVNGIATISLPLYVPGISSGTIQLAAEYSGDAAFSSSGTTKTIQVTTPTGVASVIPSAPTTVYPQYPDAQGLSWQTSISLSEVAGTPALVTGLTIDGVAQALSQYFPSTAIQPGGTLTANFVFRGLAPPVTRTFVFTGTDPTGLAWSRQVAVNYLPLPTYNYGNVNATPLTAVQNPANAACPWSVQMNIDDQGGYGIYLLSYLLVGGVDMSAQIPAIFGTTRMDAWGGLQGTLCFSNITPPATDAIYVQLSNGAFENVSVSFASPPPNPGTLSVSPAAVSIAGAPPSDFIAGTTAKLTVNLSDKTQQWTAAVYPMNRTTSWLSLSQLSGNGPASITLTANSTGFEPGAYRATIVIQSQNAVPQYINVPVMFVLGASSTTSRIAACRQFSVG